MPSPEESLSSIREKRKQKIIEDKSQAIIKSNKNAGATKEIETVQKTKTNKTANFSKTISKAIQEGQVYRIENQKSESLPQNHWLWRLSSSQV